MLEQFASGSKLAILSTAPELRDQIYIVNEDLGSWDDKNGIWWSNSSYQYRWSYKSYGSGYYGGGWSQESDAHILGYPAIDNKDYDWEAKCSICLHDLTEDDWAVGMCSLCNSCLDCFEQAYHCLCYNPTSQVRNSSDLVPMYQYQTAELDY